MIACQLIGGCKEREAQHMNGVIVFDLDDTLYLERDFALSGFKAVSHSFAQSHGRTGLEEICIGLFDRGERNAIFDKAIAIVGVEPSKRMIADLVDLYRHHVPDIRLADDASRFLRRVSKRFSLGVITDGDAATQSAKIDALGLNRIVDHIICTGVWGRAFWKPHPRAFVEMETYFGVDCSRMVYIGDNPTKDFQAPNERGWLTVQIRRPQRVHQVPVPAFAHQAHEVISSLNELDTILQQQWLTGVGDHVLA